MSKKVKLGIVACVVLVLVSVAGAQANSYYSGVTARDVIKSKDMEIASKDHDIRVIRHARDAWADAAERTAREKIKINCVQFDRLNSFVTVIARLFTGVDEVTPAQRELLKPFLEPVPRPAECN